MDWDAAEAYCVSRNGHLPSITSLQEHIDFAAMCSDASRMDLAWKSRPGYEKPCWLGLNDRGASDSWLGAEGVAANEGLWVFTDGSSTAYAETLPRYSADDHVTQGTWHPGGPNCCNSHTVGFTDAPCNGVTCTATGLGPGSSTCAQDQCADGGMGDPMRDCAVFEVYDGVTAGWLARISAEVCIEQRRPMCKGVDWDPTMLACTEAAANFHLVGTGSTSIAVRVALPLS